MASRGIVMSYATVRHCERRRRAPTGDKWYLDEMFLNINSVRHYLWRAVDQNGVVIDILYNQNATVLRPFASFASCWKPPAVVGSA